MMHIPDRPVIAIRPDHAPHVDLLHTVERYLIDHGATILPSLCYHDVLPVEIQTRLKCCLHPSAHYLRTRADRIVMTSEPEARLFEYDVKTAAARGADQQDMCLELTPTACHVLLRHQIDCLFCYRHIDGREYGFWCSDPPEVRSVFIPYRNHQFFDIYHSMAVSAFPGSNVRRIGSTRGSGDPFIVIDQSVLATLSDWRSLLSAILSPSSTLTSSGPPPWLP